MSNIRTRKNPASSKPDQHTASSTLRQLTSAEMDYLQKQKADCLKTVTNMDDYIATLKEGDSEIEAARKAISIALFTAEKIDAMLLRHAAQPKTN